MLNSMHDDLIGEFEYFPTVRTNFVRLISRASAVQCESAKRVIWRRSAGHLSDD